MQQIWFYLVKYSLGETLQIKQLLKRFSQKALRLTYLIPDSCGEVTTALIQTKAFTRNYCEYSR